MSDMDKRTNNEEIAQSCVPVVGMIPSFRRAIVETVLEALNDQSLALEQVEAERDELRKENERLQDTSITKLFDGLQKHKGRITVNVDPSASEFIIKDLQKELYDLKLKLGEVRNELNQILSVIPPMPGEPVNIFTVLSLVKSALTILTELIEGKEK